MFIDLEFTSFRSYEDVCNGFKLPWQNHSQWSTNSVIDRSKLTSVVEESFPTSPAPSSSLEP